MTDKLIDTAYDTTVKFIQDLNAQHLETIKSLTDQLSKLRAENEALKALNKDHEDDWKRIQDAERKCEALQKENEELKIDYRVLDAGYEAFKEENKTYRAALEEANEMNTNLSEEYIKIREVLEKSIDALVFANGAPIYKCECTVDKFGHREVCPPCMVEAAIFETLDSIRMIFA
jgi:chromosome segregation ATPase